MFGAGKDAECSWLLTVVNCLKYLANSLILKLVCSTLHCTADTHINVVVLESVPSRSFFLVLLLVCLQKKKNSCFS